MNGKKNVIIYIEILSEISRVLDEIDSRHQTQQVWLRECCLHFTFPHSELAISKSPAFGRNSKDSMPPPLSGPAVRLWGLPDVPERAAVSNLLI